MKRTAYLVVGVAAVLLIVSIGLQITAAVTHTSGMPGSLTMPATALASISLPLSAIAFILKRRAAASRNNPVA